jgi:defect-in-organelle-trafficking protein DotB
MAASLPLPDIPAQQGPREREGPADGFGDAAGGFARFRGEEDATWPTPPAMSADDFDRLLRHAAALRASDISFQPGQPAWAEIAGCWTRLTRRALRWPEIECLARCIYGDNIMAILNAGRDADPSYEIRDPSGPGRLRFRVNMTAGRLPGGLGVQITLRTLPALPPPIAALDVEEEILRHFRPARGLNLVCGPTGSGKSTLLAALVRWRCEKKGANEKVIEYSRPIEYVYDGLDFPDSFIWQTEVGTHLRAESGASETSVWSWCVRNALRRKPSIILVGEARDRATIEAATEAALTGHLVLTTLHTVGVPETVRRLLLPFPAEERETMAIDLLQVLNLIVTQLLVRDRTGGRTPIREFLVVTPELRHLLETRPLADWPRLLRETLSTGRAPGRSLAASARLLARQGRIDDETAAYIAARETREQARIDDGPTG